MKRSNFLGGKRFLLLLGISGGALWIASGIVLTMAPAGNPPFTFRTPAVDVRLQLAVGLLLISISLGKWILTYAKTANRKLNVAAVVTISAGLIHLLGRIIRDLFLQRTGWEPFLPLGFLLCIGGLFAMGMVSYRSKAVPAAASIFFIMTAVFLLFFNDQYLPFMAVPFGLGIIILSVFLGVHVDAEKPTQKAPNKTI